jgi:hypothetical protein
MNARILAGTLLLLSASAAAAAQPYADGNDPHRFADRDREAGIPAAVLPGGAGPAAGDAGDSGIRPSVALRGGVSLFPTEVAEAGPDGGEAEDVLAGALEQSPSGNLVAVVLGPLFPGRTDWSTPLPRDLPVTPFVTSAPGWPGAWSVGVKLPRGR